MGPGAVVGSQLPTGEGTSIDRQLAADWLAMQIQTLEAKDLEGPVAWSQASAELMRTTMLNQRDVKLEIRDCTCDEGFERASFGYLVRGLGNCHTVNFFVAQLVRHLEPAAELVTTPASSGHILVAIPVGAARVFVDGWSDYPLMSLNADVDDRVASWSSLNRRQGNAFNGLYPREAYQQAKAPPGATIRPDANAAWKNQEGPDLSVPRNLGSDASAVQAYARARVFDLYGLQALALERYDRAFEMGCVHPEAPVCQLAAAWRAKRRGHQDAKTKQVLGPLVKGDALGPFEVIDVFLANPDTIDIHARMDHERVHIRLVASSKSKHKPLRSAGGYDLFVVERTGTVDNGSIEQGLNAVVKRIGDHARPEPSGLESNL